jgi:transposase
MMLLPPSVRIYLSPEPVDLRRGHDGLAALVRAQGLGPLYGGHLFVFVGRRKDRCKILFWDRGGFVLYYKRLERGRFQMPRVAAQARHVEMDGTQLMMLLDGIDVARVARAAVWTPPPEMSAEA